MFLHKKVNMRTFSFGRDKSYWQKTLIKLKKIILSLRLHISENKIATELFFLLNYSPILSLSYGTQSYKLY